MILSREFRVLYVLHGQGVMSIADVESCHFRYFGYDLEYGHTVLQRLEKKQLVDAVWGDGKPFRKVYRITVQGHAELDPLFRAQQHKVGYSR
jgi:DNA-binding PadR family transcriptional regulator